MAGDAPVFNTAAARWRSSPLQLILTGHALLYILPETWFRQPLVREVPWRASPTQAQMEQPTGRDGRAAVAGGR